ncbi:MAG: hypothetical protein WCT85_04000 [Parachlamydiales bacterium]|jgi:hypothetical protein
MYFIINYLRAKWHPESQQCQICFEDETDPYKLIKTTCCTDSLGKTIIPQFYHKTCLQGWSNSPPRLTKRTFRCPNCRKRISKDIFLPPISIYKKITKVAKKSIEIGTAAVAPVARVCKKVTKVAKKIIIGTGAGCFYVLNLDISKNKFLFGPEFKYSPNEIISSIVRSAFPEIVTAFGGLYLLHSIYKLDNISVKAKAILGCGLAGATIIGIIELWETFSKTFCLSRMPQSAFSTFPICETDSYENQLCYYTSIDAANNRFQSLVYHVSDYILKLIYTKSNTINLSPYSIVRGTDILPLCERFSFTPKAIDIPHHPISDHDYFTSDFAYEFKSLEKRPSFL